MSRAESEAAPLVIRMRGIYRPTVLGEPDPGSETRVPTQRRRHQYHELVQRNMAAASPYWHPHNGSQDVRPGTDTRTHGTTPAWCTKIGRSTG